MKNPVGKASQNLYEIAPGPFYLGTIWTLIASMFIENVIPLITYPLLMALIIVFTIVASYSLNGSVFDVGVMIGFGFVGYLLRKAAFPMAPIALTLVLGTYFEQSLRQSLVLSKRDYSIFCRSRISSTLIGLALLAIALTVLKSIFSNIRLPWRAENSEV